jgi:pterin-4a-carbinolamine dehydratase
MMVHRMTVLRLSDEKVKARPNGLPGWTLRDAKMRGQAKVGRFARVFQFLSTCALVALSVGCLRPRGYRFSRESRASFG